MEKIENSVPIATLDFITDMVQKQVRIWHIYLLIQKVKLQPEYAVPEFQMTIDTDMMRTSDTGTAKTISFPWFRDKIQRRKQSVISTRSWKRVFCI